MDFQKGQGLLPVTTQDAQTLEILMMAYVDEEALQKTLETGKAHYYSRSKGRLWMKGETSGHIQEVHDVLFDCDEDALIFKVIQIGGAACHTGQRSCFFRRLATEGKQDVETSEKVFNPKDVYLDK